MGYQPQSKPQRSQSGVARPTDPLELAKLGDSPAGTPVVLPPPVAATPPAAPPAPEALPAAPRPPPPPAIVAQRFLVLADRRIVLGGHHATQLRKGAVVSSESYDIESLRAQGVLLQPMPD